MGNSADNSAVMIFEDSLRFNPFGCGTFDEAKQTILNFACQLNRATIYFAYLFGRFADIQQLEKKYGIKSVEDLAARMQTSKRTIYRYRSIFELITEKEAIKLADQHVSVNALLAIAELGKTYKIEARQVLDDLTSGNITDDTQLQADSIRRKIAELATANNKACNLLPGGEPPENEVQCLTQDDLTLSEDDKTPAEAIVNDSPKQSNVKTDSNFDDYEKEDKKESLKSPKDSSALTATFSVHNTAARKIIRSMAKVNNEGISIFEKMMDDRYDFKDSKDFQGKYNELVEEYVVEAMALKDYAEEIIRLAKVSGYGELTSVPSAALDAEVLSTED